MIWIRDQGEGILLSGTLRFSYFRTSFSFSLWLGEWDHFTRRTETFQKISNMYSYFLYILHCMDFRWWRGGGRMATAAGPSCGPSARGVKPPSVLRPGCCCYMQEIAPVDYWHQAHISSLGGPRHFGTGPGLTVSSLWHCLGHSQASLQCHFSRCKVGSFKGKRCRPAMGRPLRPLASFRGCRSGP